MKVYRVAWAAVSAVVVTSVCLVGLLLGDAATILLAAGTTAVFAAFLAGSTAGRRRVAPGEAAALAGVAAGTVAAATYVAGLLTAVSLVALLLASSPPALGAARRWAAGEGPFAARTGASGRDAGDRHLRAIDGGREEPLTAERLGAALQALDDHELCCAWQASWQAMNDARTETERLELVTLRQAYLDELERRRPEEFAAWLDSGASPLGNPSRFLRRRPPHPEGRAEGPDLQAS